MPAFRLAQLVFLSLGIVGAASAQDSFVAELRSVVPDSARTQILVLGTAHLSTVETPFEPADLASVLDALTQFDPDVVLVEAYAPSDVERLALAAEREPGGVAGRIAQARASLGVVSGREAQRELGLTRSGAEAEADSLLSLGPLSPTQRRRVALLFLAAHDVWSALLHWVQVPDALRGETDADRLGARYPDWTAADALNFVAATDRTELLTVGVEVARRIGLDRVHGFDGLAEVETEARTGYVPRLSSEVASSAVYAEAAEAARSLSEELRSRLEAAAASEDFLDVYLYVNSDAYARAAAEAEQVWLRTGAASGLDRARWALWETRNLEMAARLRAATAFKPGGRVLAIVGASHKRYLETLLRTLADVDIVEFSSIVPGDAP